MAVGAVAIAFSSATEREYWSWKEAAQRESDRYKIQPAYVAARMEGRRVSTGLPARTSIDWLLIGGATLVFTAFGLIARVPEIELHWTWLVVLSLAMLVVLIAGGVALWRTTRFD